MRGHVSPNAWPLKAVALAPKSRLLIDAWLLSDDFGIVKDGSFDNANGSHWIKRYFLFRINAVSRVSLETIRPVANEIHINRARVALDSTPHGVVSRSS